MQPDHERYEMNCPKNGLPCVNGIRPDFKPNASGVVKQCRFWTHVYGKDPQSEKITDHFDCSQAWMPVIMLEVSQMSRFNTASVDKVANTMEDIGGKIRASFGDLVNAFLNMADSNRELIEFKKNEPSIIEIPANGKEGGHDGDRLE